jgi:hypothetical protein
MWQPSLYADPRRLAGLLLVESSPLLSKRTLRPFDLDMKFDFTDSRPLPRQHLNLLFPERQLPISLKHLATGPVRQPFAVFERFESLLGRRYPPLSGLEVELETSTRRELTLFNDGKKFLERDVYCKVDYSLWVLAVHQWQENLDYLKEDFRRLRFAALEKPGRRTYLPLINLRQLIVGMRDKLVKVLADNDALDKKIGRSELLRLSLRPSASRKILTRIAKELEKLDKDLNDEIHLIIGAVTVQDSDANKEQTERATLLTLLAAVYLPLTLVTGIFGMNIKDIDVGKPGWRACAIAFAVVGTCTALFVFGYRRWRVWRRAQQERERMELGFDKLA